MNTLLEHASRCDNIYLSKKGPVLPANVKQTIIEQKSDLEQIPSTRMTTPKKKRNKSDVMNVDKNETITIPNGTNFREKDSHRKDNHQPLKKNCRKILKATTATIKEEIILLKRSLLITQNQSSY